MNDNLLIDTEYIGDYRIKIYYDEVSQCPVKIWDMGAAHLFEHLEHGRYWLSSECNWEEWVSTTRDESVAGLLQRMAAKVVEQQAIIDYYKAGKVKNLRFSYNRRERQWELQTKPTWKGANAEWIVEYEVEPYDLRTYDNRMELLEPLDEEELLALIKECAKDFVIKEWSSCGYCQGDDMRGVSYMSKERFDKRCGFNPKCYKTWQEQAMAVIEGEIKCLGMWAWGDVKGYVLEKKISFTKVYDDENREDEKDVEWEEVGSCWGFYMTTEELIKEVVYEHNLKETA